MSESNGVRQANIFIPAIRDFVSGEVSAEQFEKIYLNLVKVTPGTLEPQVSQIVNTLFGDVDAYVSDDDLRDDDDLDADQLHDCARDALNALERIQ